jgi:hypothetical protein
MKKLLSGIAVLLLAGFVAAPAQADIDVVANVNLTKNVLILENITKFKTLFIDVDGNPLTEGAAEALVLVNVTNTGNTVTGNDSGEEPLPDGRLFDAFIGPGGEGGEGSINNNEGVVHVNQDVGNNVNQANVLASAISDVPSAAANSEAVVDQINTLNSVTFTGLGDPSNPEKNTTITVSVNDNTGIVGVNQNAGDMNNQTNAVAVALGDDGDSTFALSNAFLGQVNMGNTVTERDTVRAPTIEDSILSNTGIVTVNQTPGNMNNQGTIVSFSGTASIF